MTTYFISRHPGARTWVLRQGISVDQFVDHLELDRLCPGDTVIGTLPVNLIALLQRMDVRYFHLSLAIPAGLRGKELSAEQLDTFGARLTAYRIEEIPETTTPEADC